MTKSALSAASRSVSIAAGHHLLEGEFDAPRDALGLVIFAHGSGSSRHSPRNRQVARALRSGGLATLLFDLLTSAEEEYDRPTAALRFDIGLLAERLAAALEWSRLDADARRFPVGLFGASTGAAAALVVAARHPDLVHAVVSRGGRPDLAGPALRDVRAPTLLVVGGADPTVLALNAQAARVIAAPVKLAVIPRATHLFEEPGALEQVAALAREWFVEHLTKSHISPKGDFDDR